MSLDLPVHSLHSSAEHIRIPAYLTEGLFPHLFEHGLQKLEVVSDQIHLLGITGVSHTLNSEQTHVIVRVINFFPRALCGAQLNLMNSVNE